MENKLEEVSQELTIAAIASNYLISPFDLLTCRPGHQFPIRTCEIVDRTANQTDGRSHILNEHFTFGKKHNNLNLISK